MKRYTKEDLLSLVDKCTSIRQMLKLLGLKEAGGNYANIKRLLAKFEIDTSHFKGSGWNKGETCDHNKVDPSDYLICDPDSHRTSYKIKRWILRDGIKPHKCEYCAGETQLDNPIPLELHHKNGISYDFRIENIELRCPNCHALTENYRGKNIGKVQ